jgi:ribosome-binding factor A
MTSIRQYKFSRQILKDINAIFQKDPKHYFGDRLVTITDVEVAIDLSLAKVFFSVLPANDGTKVLQNLNLHKSEIRRKLGMAIGKRVRKIPELAFFHDSTGEKAAYMDKLIDSLDIPPDPDQTTE